jgi:hypothetical protein
MHKISEAFAEDFHVNNMAIAITSIQAIEFVFLSLYQQNL